MSVKKLYIVDISSYVFRAYYAIRPLQNSKGESTHATYGVITMLMRMIREKKPDYLVIAFDSSKASFRKEIYSEYKANRQEVPEDLPAQFGHVRDFVSRYPLPMLQKDGYEADDLIATLVRHYREKKEGFSPEHKDRPEEVIIVSPDKDLMQLVGDGVIMYDSARDRVIGVPEVKERFGVGPEKVLDVLSLAGDASDNIPGVLGIGEKTAAKLIDEWGSLENLFEHVDEIKGKVSEKLKTDRENAFLSKKLASLCDDIPLHEDWKLFQVDAPHWNQLNEFFREFEFHSLIQQDAGGTAVPEAPLQVSSLKADYELILTEEQMGQWAARLANKEKGFSFDTETTGLNPLSDELVGLSLADGSGQACYIPLCHSYLGCPQQLPKEKVLAPLRPLFANPSIPKWAQNAKFDMEVLCREEVIIKGLAGDSMIASYMLNPEGVHNLDHLAKEHLNHTTILFGDVVSKGKIFADVELERAVDYAAEDAEVAYQLTSKLHPLLKKEKVWECYSEIELPLIEVLFRMEVYGVFVDIPFLNNLSHEFNAKLIRLEQEIYELSGTEFNVNSPKQLAEILFNKLGLPPQRKTKTGYSTDVDVLKELSSLHPMPERLLEHRTIAKLKSTYVDQLRKLVNTRTGRIHTSYNQVIAATGRLSSSDPNLQNIPIRSEEGRRIRQAFRAQDGWKIISADYSQIELRLLAAFSEDPQLVEAFRKGEDIHHLTAEKIFGAPVDSRKRAMAKTVNFGILYGQSGFGLAQLLGIPQSEARKSIEEFYNQYPKVKEYKEKMLEEIRTAGEVRTWKGRRRLVPDIRSQNNTVRSAAERFAFNTIFQGSAADLIKIAMIQIDQKLGPSLKPEERKYRTRMIMQVHDELIFEAPEDEVEEVSKMIQKEMENAVKCAVPLKVEIGVGTNWDEAH